MRRRGTFLGLAVICALALSAVGASGAFAGATAFTCVPGGGAGPDKFKDADCSRVNGLGTFGHETIAAGTSTTVTLNKLANPIVTLKAFGATIEMEATGFECVGCTGENASVGGVMESSGTGRLQFTGVTVVGAPACTVVGSAPGVITTPNLKFTTTSPAEVTFEPESGTLMAEFKFTGESCVLTFLPFSLTGKAKATLSGAKLTFNVTKASGELQYGSELAGLKAELTVEEGSGATHHAVALTTA